MAVDTRNKRGSSIAASLPFFSIYPNPDGAIDSYEDREQSIGIYRLQDTDTTAPVFSVGPIVGVVTTSSAQITGTVTDDTPPITVYAVVVADGAGAPSAAQIKAGTDSLDAAAPNNNEELTNSGDSFGISIGGLTSGTAYDIYYTATDFVDNDATPGFVNATTTSPAAATGTSPIAAITSINARRNRRRF